MPIAEPLYKHDQTIIKIIGYGEHKKIKVSTFKTLRTEGIEDEKKQGFKPCYHINQEKLQTNISRAKNMIFEYAFCNDWQFFFTGTIDSRKLDRSNLDNFRKKFSYFIGNFNRYNNCDVKYLIVPELHFDGKNWHIHGLLSNLPKESVIAYQKGKGKINKSILDLINNGTQVYYWKDYQSKFGFCDLTYVRDPESISKYITKYLNKNIGCSVKQLNAHLYYCSKGLAKCVVIKKGRMLADIPPDYENDYCKITTFPYSDELINFLCENIVYTRR